MVTPHGVVKILDFGLAKLLRGSDASQRSTRLTTAGTMVGTVPYMSPEQVRGETVDHHSDIWSFGCLLYEMLTGQMLFAARTTGDHLAAILEHDPPMKDLPAGTPRRLRDLMKKEY